VSHNNCRTFLSPMKRKEPIAPELIASLSCHTWDKYNVSCGCLRASHRWGRRNAKSDLLRVSDSADRHNGNSAGHLAYGKPGKHKTQGDFPQISYRWYRMHTSHGSIQLHPVNVLSLSVLLFVSSKPPFASACLETAFVPERINRIWPKAQTASRLL